MKSIDIVWIVAIAGMILSTVPSTAQANDPGLCFMKTSSGKSIDLGAICAKASDSADIIIVPIKRRQAKTPIIDVTFNGSYVCEMIFDTGASGILITQQSATALRVKPMGIMKGRLADGSIVVFETGHVNSVAVGSLVVNQPTVAIAPNATIGLLGHGFFQNYDVQILDQFIELRKR
jgi:aspartyl protease family protein